MTEKNKIYHNEEIENAVNTLYSKLKDAEYNAKYSWKELFELSGLQKMEMDKLYYVANKVCLMLMQFDQKYLMTVQGFGKRIINPAEHSVVAKKKVKTSVKIYKRAGAVLASTNMDMLTDDQKKQVIDDANKYSTLEMFANEMLKKKMIGTAKDNDIRTAGLFLDAIKLLSGRKS